MDAYQIDKKAKATHSIGSNTSRDPEIADSSALPSDWSELFLAEMHSRRERLAYWMRLIGEAHSAPASPPSRKGAHRCRGLASGPARTQGRRR
jgi:hypothetical protein